VIGEAKKRMNRRDDIVVMVEIGWLGVGLLEAARLGVVVSYVAIPGGFIHDLEVKIVSRSTIFRST